MTVGEMLDRMTNGEFMEWMVYYGRRKQEQELAQAFRR